MSCKALALGCAAMSFLLLSPAGADTLAGDVPGLSRVRPQGKGGPGGHDDQLSQKFKAMDYFRVKSIHRLLQSNKVKAEDEVSAKEELVRKAKILLLGYEKHNNLDHYDEVKGIKELYE